MTARKNLKRLIRLRMRRTGESYTTARHHFLHPLQNAKEHPMNRSANRNAGLPLNQSIDELQLTLRTSRILKSSGIEQIGQLLSRSERERRTLGLDSRSEVELREVLASRGY